MSLHCRKRRSRKGASLIESALAAVFLIPIALATVDLMTLVFANSVNDTVAKNCARAGANQPNGGAALQAANKALATFKTSGIIKSIVLDDLNYTGDDGQCTCTTTMIVNLPIPFPGFTTVTFTGRAVETVVGKADPDNPAP